MSRRDTSLYNNGQAFAASSAPQPLFEVRGFRAQNDVSADGQSFLGTLPVGTVETAGDPATPPINIVLNWFEELKERVPTGGQR